MNRWRKLQVVAFAYICGLSLCAIPLCNAVYDSILIERCMKCLQRCSCNVVLRIMNSKVTQRLALSRIIIS